MNRDTAEYSIQQITKIKNLPTWYMTVLVRKAWEEYYKTELGLEGPSLEHNWRRFNKILQRVSKQS